mmetsp:Transcript_1860/g.4040  ORF Transcript_1860/g.4040 Transcript_1860/m.4040 type:complete len:290 (+) Transcript_1860:23-892(+)
MCWNEEVSYIFATAEVLFLTAIWCMPKTRPYAKTLTPLAITVIIVELFEAVSWPYVVDLDDRLAHRLDCPLVNAILTQVLALNVDLQPFACAIIAYRTPPGVEHPHVGEIRMIGVLGMVYFLAKVLSVVVTLATDPNDRPREVDSYGTLYGATSMDYITACAYKGSNGHQLWQVATSSSYRDIFPGLFSYFSIMIAAFLFVYDKVEAVFWVGFVALFFAMAGPLGPEAGSMWCWSGMLLFTFYTVFPHVKDLLQVPVVTSWWDFLPGKCGQRAGTRGAAETQSGDAGAP